MPNPRIELRTPAITTASTAGAVFFTALAGITLTEPTGRVPALWLANAIVILMLLRWPARTWPLWLVAGFAGNLAADLVAGYPFPMALHQCLCNLVEILLAGWLVRRYCGGATVDLGRGGALLRFLALGGALAPAVAALLASLGPGPGDLPFWTGCRAWFLADALGILILVPLVQEGSWGRVTRLVQHQPAAVLACLAAGLASGLLVASGHLAWLFLLGPLFLASVFQAGFLGGSAAVGLAALAGVAALAFQAPLPAAAFRAQVEYLQCVIVINLLVSLTAANLLAERERAHRASAESQALLVGSIDAASDYIWSVEPARFTLLTCNASLCGECLATRAIKLRPGMTLEEMYPDPEVAAWWRRTHREALEQGRLRTEYQLQGGARTLALNLNVVRRDGRPYCITVFARDVTALKQTEKEIRNLNEHLEARVAERTAELEAFTYSVSHDLRGPLRAIDGFSQVLLADHGPNLDAEARRLLGRVRHGTQRMGWLIDDLLKLSRLSRGTLDRRPVDLSALAREVAADLARSHPDRTVRVAVEPGLWATGDLRLLGIALHNLLDNAWKYTVRTEQAEIRVGGRMEDGQTILWVRDNGAGFDMAYAGKLFSPFQRLHADPEFEGNGIGLAIVQRILQRHGGDIRAQAEPGRGAAFILSLPDDPSFGPGLG